MATETVRDYLEHPSDSSTTSAGGIAADAAGNLLDMPRDLAHKTNAELLDVLTLLHSVRLNEESEVDRYGLTDRESRSSALLAMIEDKVRGALRSMSPYV